MGPHALEYQLQNSIKSFTSLRGNNNIDHSSSLEYFHKYIKRVNEREDDHGTQAKKFHTILVKVSSLSNKKSKQNDQSIAWIMFHSISGI